MKPLSHLALTAPLAGAVTWYGGLVPAVWFSSGAILIDIDHYIFYVRRTGKFDPTGIMAWFENHDSICTPDSYMGLNIFHAVEFFIILSVASIFLHDISWLLLGMGYHLLLDLAWMSAHPVIRVRIRALSWTEHFVRKRRGETELWRNGSNAGTDSKQEKKSL